MILDRSIPELVDRVDAATIRVHAPIPTLLVCGGKVDVEAPTPPSLREAFNRVFYTHPPFRKYSLLMAEDVNAFFPEGKYQDILSFESDIAQISDLIVLFSESYGSAAELGAFAMVEEISIRMLAVLDDKNYSERSFIALGPIRMLENKVGPTSICVLNRADLKIAGISDVSGMDLNEFARIMSKAVINRKDLSKEHTTFDRDRPGHIIKLIVGLIQHYGALTIDEIDLFLDALGCKQDAAKIEDFLLCARFVRWIVKERRGVETYYAARSGNEALQYKQKLGAPLIDKARWRADIREYWRNADIDRYNAIGSAILS